LIDYVMLCLSRVSMTLDAERDIVMENPSVSLCASCLPSHSGIAYRPMVTMDH